MEAVRAPAAKAASRKKKAEEVIEAAPVVETPAAPKPSRTRRKVEQPVISEVATPVERAPRRLFGRNRQAKPIEKEEPVAEATLFPEEPAAVAKPARKTSRAKAAPARPEFRVDDIGDDMPMPIFRPRQQVPTGGSSRSDQPDDRRGGRGRRGRAPEKAIEITAEGAVEVLATEETAETPVKARFRERRKPADRKAEAVAPEPTPEPEPPKPPVKPIIPTPEDAPQIVLRDGLPTLVRKGRVYPPMVFFGSSTDERRAQTVLDELKMAGEAGIHLHSHLIEFEVDPEAVDTSVAVAAYMLKKSVEIDPESQVIFRIVFQAGRNWQQKFSNAKFNMEGGGVAEPSISDDDFWGVAKDCLTTFVRKLRMLDLKEHILGVHLERGEWFLAAGWGYDDSIAARNKFREWTRHRYQNDEVALRASWFDGGAKFENIQVPKYMPEGSEGERFVRASRKQRRYVDYHLFLSDMTVQRIGDLAYGVKEVSEGYFIVGVSYGYTFEWSHPGSGHLSLGKLLRTPEIDFIAGPPSYRSREPGGSSPFPGPIDSYALNGKLYISEEDFKTSLSGGHEPDDFNPVIKTPQALESVHWRGAGVALAHGSGVAWMDLWGNGWLKTPTIWDRGHQVREALVERMGSPLGEPEVVVFIDERALAYLVDQNAFRMLVQSVRESVLRAGVNAGFYLLSDLAHRERFPEAKLYLFLNAWDIRPDLRAAIKSRLQRDNKVLFWLYSAGLFDAGRDSLERAREVTGIALKPQPFHSRSGTTILARRHALTSAFPSRSLGGERQLEPSYFAIPEEATVLGEYSQTGLPSFVVRDFETEGQPELNWTSVFLGEPAVNAALVRALAQMAGAHVYNFHEDVVHVRPPFLTVHCTGTGPRSLTLPGKWSAYDALSGEWMGLDHTTLRFTGIDGTTHTFLIGPREELQHLLSLKPEEMLRMDELPPKDDNFFREDGLGFDVPIMKLDQWMEGADSDEIADEWFLRPQQILEEPEGESEKVGKRRPRRRGRRGDRGGSEESASARPEPSGTVSEQFEDLGMSVMFRKRE